MHQYYFPGLLPIPRLYLHIIIPIRQRRDIQHLLLVRNIDRLGKHHLANGIEQRYCPLDGANKRYCYGANLKTAGF